MSEGPARRLSRWPRDGRRGRRRVGTAQCPESGSPLRGTRQVLGKTLKKVSRAVPSSGSRSVGTCVWEEGDWTCLLGQKHVVPEQVGKRAKGREARALCHGLLRTVGRPLAVPATDSAILSMLVSSGPVSWLPGRSHRPGSGLDLLSRTTHASPSTRTLGSSPEAHTVSDGALEDESSNKVAQGFYWTDDLKSPLWGSRGY